MSGGQACGMVLRYLVREVNSKLKNENENVQDVGSKLYFDSLNSNRRPFYCVILAMGTLADCLRELKRFEDLALHHPLVHEDYMIPKDNRELMHNPNHHNSCICEPLRIYRIAETVLKTLEHAEK
jgi:hypothetical protein